MYLSIRRSCAAERNLLSAKLIIGKSLPAQLLAPHMCKIKRKFHLGKTKNSFFLFSSALRHVAGKWSLTGERSQPHTKCFGKFA